MRKLLKNSYRQNPTNIVDYKQLEKANQNKFKQTHTRGKQHELDAERCTDICSDGNCMAVCSGIDRCKAIQYSDLEKCK